MDREVFGVQFGFDPVGYGVFQMRASFRWPDVDVEDSVIRHAAISAMRKSAKAAGMGDGDIREIGAEVDRSDGLSLSIDRIGACDLSTGHNYRPNQDIVVLTNHNLYSPNMQLVLCAGVVGIEELNH